MPALVNGLTNPSFELNTTTWSTTGGTVTLSRVTTEKRSGTASAQAVCTGAGGIRVSAANAPAYPAGTRVTVAAWVKAPLGASMSLQANEFTLPSTGQQTATTPFTGTGAWQLVTATIAATGAAGNVVRPTISLVSGTGTFFVDDVAVGTAVPFDGDTPDDSTYRYDWTGTAHASTSTATPWVDVSLVPSGDPNPVQLVITGIPNGVAYEVVGTTEDGSLWPVPGGVGVSDGGQIVLVDNRGALNTPTTYFATWEGIARTSLPITVPYARKYVLQSLDGQDRVDFWWLEDGLPQEPVVRSQVYDVPGRTRPPSRFAAGGDGGGSMQVRTNLENSAALRALLRSGRPVVIRTDGQFRDFPAVELAHLTAAPNQLSRFAAIDTRRTDRVWNLAYTLIGDPEPSVRLSAWTGDDFDAAMATRTGTDFDALFVGSTWDQFDTYPWGQLI